VSTKINFLGNPDDPRELELLRGLEAKTREGKIRWSKAGSAITASVSNGLKLNFVLSTNVFTSVSDWQLFTVRDRRDSELVRVSGMPAFALAGAGTSALTVAADRLFRLAMASVRDDLDSAIDSVKNL
jgi:hypothetical protein